MSNRLSHSSVTKFQHCGQAWKFHYVDKVRPTKSHAALMFGTALDRATGVLMDPGTETKTPEQIFEYFWRFQDVNGKQEYLPTLVSLAYAKTDWDEELLSDLDWLKLYEHSISVFKDLTSPHEIPYTEKDHKNIVLQLVDKRNKQGFEFLTFEEKKLVNHAFWMCLKQKGLLMVKAFRNKVMPRLTAVLATQKQINLENEDGDSVVGYIDLIADVDGHGIVVLDVKTSARAYDEETSVIYSPQLSLYVHAVSDEYKTRKAGFIVLNKAIIKNRKKICTVCKFNGSGGRAKTCDQETMQDITNKKGVTESKLARCNGEWNESIDPDVYVQFLIEEIPQATEDLVLANIDEINSAIKTGVYTKNLSACLNSFGRPCEYLDLCYRGDMKDLVKMEKK